MSSKERKARRVALREFLIAVPGGLERLTASLGWLVLLGAVALVAMLLHLAFGGGRHPPVPMPAGPWDNPSSALYVRDLGRLSDGRHTFDLVYEMVLRNATPRPVLVAYTLERLTIGDPPQIGDVVDLGRAPGATGAAVGAWHDAISHRSPGSDLLPGQWRAFRAHYRIQARADQFADVAIGYGLHRETRGWFGHADHIDDDGHDEDIQLGAVLRARCALGVKVQNGEVKSLCAN